MAERKKKIVRSTKTTSKKKTASKKTNAGKKKVAKQAAPKSTAEKKGGNGDPLMTSAVTEKERWQMIAETAYFLAEKRGFVGDPIEHWVAAEKTVDAQLSPS